MRERKKERGKRENERQREEIIINKWILAIINLNLFVLSDYHL